MILPSSGLMMARNKSGLRSDWRCRPILPPQHGSVKIASHMAVTMMRTGDAGELVPHCSLLWRTSRSAPRRFSRHGHTGQLRMRPDNMHAHRRIPAASTGARALPRASASLHALTGAAAHRARLPALQRPLTHARHTDGARRGVRVTKGRGAVRRRPPRYVKHCSQNPLLNYYYIYILG